MLTFFFNRLKESEVTTYSGREIKQYIIFLHKTGFLETMNQDIIKSIATLAGYLASLAATFVILQPELISRLTEERRQNGERLRLALVDRNIASEKYKRRLKR